MLQNNQFLRITSSIVYGVVFLLIIHQITLFPFLIFLFVLISGSIYEIIIINKQNNFKQLIITFIECIYVIITFILLISIKSNEHGGELILILMLQVWATDIGGYVIGTKFGQHKLTKISNKKTWEGVIGSISFCLGTSIILRKIIILYTPSIHFLILSIIICISSIIGDLIISKIKRINNIKDSGVFLPGHGGFLDRLDSLFFATPIYYFIISI